LATLGKGELNSKDPAWRVTLCWGSVLIFLGAPVFLLILQIVDHLNPQDIEVAKSMSPMYFAIAAVVGGLAGLGTWQNIKNGRGNG
jgi:hypothetical protein